MRFVRTQRFAAIQAKLRARIGKLPDETTWRRLALSDHPGFDDLADVGVDFWLENLPREFGGDTLERHFNGRVRVLMEDTANWLPDSWSDFGHCLRVVPDIFLLRPVLNNDLSPSVLDRHSLLNEVVGIAGEQRVRHLHAGLLSPFLGEPEHCEEIWYRELLARIPPLKGAERLAMVRLRKILEAYVTAKDYRFQQIAQPAAAGIGAGEPARFEQGAWLPHRELEFRLRLSLAGDPFQPALILAYTLIELLTMEKLKALLLSRLLGWPVPPVLRGAA